VINRTTNHAPLGAFREDLKAVNSAQFWNDGKCWICCPSSFKTCLSPPLCAHDFKTRQVRL